MQTVLDEIDRQIAVRELELYAINDTLRRLYEARKLLDHVLNGPGDEDETDEALSNEPDELAEPVAEPEPVESKPVVSLAGCSTRECCEDILAGKRGFVYVQKIAEEAIGRGYKSTRESRSKTAPLPRAINAFRGIMNYHEALFERAPHNVNLYRLRPKSNGRTT